MKGEIQLSNICYNCFQKIQGDICPHCGFDPTRDSGQFPHALPYGTVLGGRYITGRVLGQGGFGITYIAQDPKTTELVAIKEFFPDTMVTRGATNSAVPFSERQNGDFTYGKTTFLDEAKTLAQFNGHPNIVGIKSYFEENGTAYFAMEYVEGSSLQHYVNSRGGKLTWEDTAAILLPIMEALSVVHAKGIIHRDIKPDNIFINQDGAVKLLDFGSARYSMGEKSRSLDVILTHGFAPKEQYSRHGRQGAYTDVYALAATWYYTITGRKPPDSIDRVEEDDLIPPSTLGASLTEAQEDALLKALSVSPTDRYQTMGEFRAAIGETVPDLSTATEQSTATERPGPTERPDSTEHPELSAPEAPVPSPTKKRPQWLIPVLGAAAVVAIVIAVVRGGAPDSVPVKEATPEAVSVFQPEQIDTMETTLEDSPSQPPVDLSGAVITQPGDTAPTPEATETVSLETQYTSYSSDGTVWFFTTTEYNEYGERTKEINFDPDGSVDYWTEYIYDDRGNNIEEIEVEADGSISDRYVRTFDDQNNMLTSHYYNEEGQVRWWYEYCYDDQGNEIKSIDYNGDGSVDCWDEHTYDAEGNAIKWIKYNGDGSVDYWYEYTYDTEGNRIESIEYNGDGSIDHWNEYTYDTEGNGIKSIEYNGDGSIDHWNEHTYDAEGNKIKSIEYNGDGSVDCWDEYTYDAEGRMRMHVTYDADGTVEYRSTYDARGHEVLYERLDEDTGALETIFKYEYAYDIDGNILGKNTYYKGELDSVRTYAVTQVLVRDTTT